MSEVYIKEPSTNGKVILHTTHGDLEAKQFASHLRMQPCSWERLSFGRQKLRRPAETSVHSAWRHAYDLSAKAGTSIGTDNFFMFHKAYECYVITKLCWALFLT
eukprot:5176009-Amphidinium_carterae.1